MKSQKCHQPLGEAKEEWKIFRALSEKFDTKLNFNNISELRNKLATNFPNFKELNTINMKLDINYGSDKQIKSRLIDYNIKNFYMNDVISRNSITMANCSKEILKKT